MLINDSYSPDTLASYLRWFTKFSNFCSQVGQIAIPASGECLELFIAQCFKEGYRDCTIRAALSAISYHHTINRQVAPIKSARINRLLRGIKKAGPVKDKLLPIRYGLLKQMVGFSHKIHSNYERALVRVALLLMYHGCLRVGEIANSHSAKHTLNIDGLKVISKKGTPCFLKLTLNSHKHSLEPISCRIASVKGDLCPVQAALHYTRLRGSSPGPFLRMKSGKDVSRAYLANKLKFLIKQTGRDTALYNTHSIRCGRATDMAIAGIPELVIKRTGRWKSNAYLRYVRFDNFVVPRAR